MRSASKPANLGENSGWIRADTPLVSGTSPSTPAPACESLGIAHPEPISVAPGEIPLLQKIPESLVMSYTNNNNTSPVGSPRLNHSANTPSTTQSGPSTFSLNSSGTHTPMGPPAKNSPPNMKKKWRGSMPTNMYKMEATSNPSSPRVSPKTASKPIVLQTVVAEVLSPYKCKEGLILRQGEEVKVISVDNVVEGCTWTRVENSSGEQGLIPRSRIMIIEEKVMPVSDAQELIKLSSVTITNVDDPDVVKQGYLLKRSGLRRNWKSRFFILNPEGLTYYHSQHSGKIPLGHLNLQEDRTNIHIEKAEVTDKLGASKNVFVIKVPHRKEMFIDAGTSIELEAWITALETVLGKETVLTSFPA